MSLDQDLVRLVREVVKAELNSSRTNATEIVGRGGDTVLSSMGNIFIQPGTNKKAYYHETEIGSGSGGGGAVSSVFGRTGAVTAQSGDYSAYYLLLTAGSGAPLTGDLYIDKTTPGLVLKNAGTIKGYVQATATEFDIYPNAVLMSLGDLGQALYNRGSSIIFKTAVGDVTRLTIADALITSTVDLTIDKGTPGLILKNSGTIKGYVQATATEFDVYPNGVTMSLGDATQLIEVYCTQLDMNSKKIVGLAAATTNGDALRYEQLIGAYLPLSAGSGAPLTGDLYIDKVTPGLVLKHSSVIKGYVQATATEFDVYPSGVKMSLGDGAQLLDLYGSTIALSGTLTINNSTLVTNLNADLLDGSHASAFATSGHTHSTYLLLTAGSGQALTGDLYIDKATPGIVLKNSTVIKGYVQATATEFDVYPSGVPMSLGDLGQVLYNRGSSIVFKTAVGDVTRLTIADAAITAAVDVVLGTNKLRGTAGGGSDVILGDDISMLKAAATYGDIKNVGVLSFGSSAAQKIDNNAGSLRFTVAAGEVFEFVVSA